MQSYFSKRGRWEDGETEWERERERESEREREGERERERERKREGKRERVIKWCDVTFRQTMYQSSVIYD